MGVELSWGKNAPAGGRALLHELRVTSAPVSARARGCRATEMATFSFEGADRIRSRTMMRNTRRSRCASASM
jgi:hypothetical protein